MTIYLKKVCRICKIDKPLSEYTIDNSREDNINTKCKSCHAATHLVCARDRRVTDHEKIKNDPNAIKRCRTCGEKKPLTGFGKDKYTNDGYQSKCKDCNMATYKIRIGDPRAAAREKIKAENTAKRKKFINDPNSTKTCSFCRDIKLLSEFHKNKSNEIDGRDSRCKPCVAASKKQSNKDFPERKREAYKRFEQKHPGRRKARYAEYREKNREKERLRSKKQRAKDPAKARAAVKRSEIKHPHKKRAHVALRRARKIQRTPPWLTKEHRDAFVETHRQCLALKKLTGIGFDADHIVPLVGVDSNGNRNVSGLHVPWNVEPRVASENRSKSNRFDTTLDY